MIRHMVAVRFPAGLSRSDRDRHFQRLDALRGHLSGIADFRTFRNISPETAIVRGFDDLFWFDFADAAARDAYLADPAHQAAGAALVAALQRGIEDLLVIDIDL